MHGNNPNKLRRVTTCGVLALILAVIVGGYPKLCVNLRCGVE